MSIVNILVVDDRPEGLMAVEAVLRSPLYNIVTAPSGLEALKKLLDYDFAVIILDVQMPGMNGFEVAEVIKTREKSKDIPIVFMSAINQDEQYVYQGYGVGAVDYLLKPFDPYILKSKVRIFADLFLLRDKIKEQAQRLHESDLKIYAQAMDKLELESLRKYQYLADAIPQVVFRLQPDGTYTYFNKVWFELTGLGEPESMGLGWKDAIHDDDLAKLLGIFQIAQEGGQEIECRIRTKEGDFRWHLIRMEPEIYSDQKRIKTWLGTATDIQERKVTEETQRLLAQAGELLVSSLDFKENVHKLRELAVPRIADVFSIEILDEEGELTLQSEIPTEAYSFGNKGKSLIVTLFANGKSFGLMRFEFTASDRTYNRHYIELVLELGRRVAMAHENSHLYKISKDAVEIRNDFLSIASHELNTPITSLKLQLQLVMKALQTESVGELPIQRFQTSVGTSLKQVDRLIQLVKVLLDVSRIQSGKFTFSYKNNDLAEIVHEVAERHSEIITNNGCVLNVSEVPHVKVYWDKMRIEQVLTNLIINAVKYAPGDIELKVTEELNNIKIEIIDHGPGIDEDKLTSIFHRFERASTSDTIGGLGLGLYIVKEIVQGHQGEITVSSEPGRGTVFTVLIPADPEASRLGDLSEFESAHLLT